MGRAEVCTEGHKEDLGFTLRKMKNFEHRWHGRISLSFNRITPVVLGSCKWSKVRNGDPSSELHQEERWWGFVQDDGIRCCCSVDKLFLTLWHPMNGSTPGFPVFHISQSLLKHMSFELVMPSNHWMMKCHPPSPHFFSYPQSFPASGFFPVSHLFTSGSQSFGVSASASVLPKNTQGGSPLGLTGLTSLQSKGLSRIFSGTTIQKHQFFSTQPSSWSSSHIHT